MRRACIVVALATLVLPSAAEACRCVQQTPQAAYRRASAVLVGTVSRATDASPYDRSVRIEVERSWKQRFEGPVSVNGGRTTCSADLQPGQRYLIYVIAGPDRGLWTSRCLGTRPITEAGSALAWLERQD